jgi:hypothetical protein
MGLLCRGLGGNGGESTLRVAMEAACVVLMQLT